ncbi:TOB2 protein, partial [Polypterus senegalus]
MHLEIKVALNFIISYLYNKLPRRRADLFGEELERLLTERYEGHWYPERPLKGSGFRCLHIGEMVDPVVELAARRSGLDTEEVRSNVPQELSVWIDPFEVSYQIGEKGAVKVLYLEDTQAAAAAASTGPAEQCCTLVESDMDKENKSTSFNPDAQVFVPIGGGVDGGGPMGGAHSLSSSPSPPNMAGSVFGHSPSPTSFLSTPVRVPPQPITFTTASFAATKFGSTKMKKGGGQQRVVRSPTNAATVGAGLSKHKSLSLSLHSLGGLGTSSSSSSSQLSPNAKEFVYPGSPASSAPGPATSTLYFDGEAHSSQFAAPSSFDPFGSTTNGSGGLANSLYLDKTPFVDRLGYNLNTMQYPSQAFQPVVLAN